MSEFMNPFNNMLSELIHAIPNVIAALLLLVLAWIVAAIAKGIVEKVFVKLGVHKGLIKTKIANDEEHGKSILAAAGKVIYLLVFILFLPAILDALEMNSVSAPISNMMNKLLGFIPNIIAAAVILIIGYIIAKLVKDLLEKFLVSLNVDRWFRKVKPAGNQQGSDSITISSVLANIVFVLILIPIVTIALDTLEMQAIANPITSVLNQVLAIIPNIFVAIILVIAGYYLANLLGNLLTNLLKGTGINNIYSTLNMKTEDKGIPFDLAKVLGTAVKVLILLFFTVEALNLLQLDVLNNIGAAVITYIPFLVSGLLILGGGLLLGHFLANVIKKYTNSGLSATIVKYIVIVFAVFMTLDQLQFATSIVNLAFVLILGGLMVAFAISFGIGGRDFAKNQLTKLDSKMNQGE
ncbi:mechanosensitive ion channel [Gracilibacillus salitolerans]|uniref:Mechanosensitive ion channel n=1 Tax=Gracilibacillus salitolerans TaxID=2663022 RepID=A0A5Q2TM00_9BACI|nr:mechanosensitive ion channel [Gracilibacillus salitolerans]QGH35003.1 mechanosensitive ion channel [Gracilibacillus salitolerans]